MWEEQTYFIKEEGLISPSDCIPFANSIQIEPTSPSLSSTGNGSPYSSSLSGSMSPDTTSPGGIYWNGSDGESSPILENDVFFQKGIFFGQGWPLQGTGGTLPSLHEWRKIDQERKYLQQQHQPLRFIFPLVPDSGSVTGKQNESVGFESNFSVNNSKLSNSTHPECIVSSTSSPIKCRSGKIKGQVESFKNKGNNGISSTLIGQRVEKFMKSFASSSPNLCTTSVVNNGINLISTKNTNSSLGKPFDLDCLWIDCKASFQQKEYLIEHIDRVHIQTRKEDFSCFWHGCVRRNRPFNARYKLLIHMRVHTGHKPNKCTIAGCDKAFSRLENLKIHLRSHTGERPYICPHCPKAFSNSSDRAKHQRTHFDSKPYACVFPNCVKRYTDPSSLRKHAKMHYMPKKIIISSKEEKKEGRRNRRKNNCTSTTYTTISKCPLITSASSFSSDGAVKPAPLMQIAPIEPKGEKYDCQEILTGNGDPSLGQLETAHTSLAHESSFSLITPSPLLPSTESTDLRTEQENPATSDLDGIPMGDLDWISGVNFDDDHFDIDYFI